MKTTLKASRDKLKQLFAQHIRPTVEHSQPQDEPISAPLPISTISVTSTKWSSTRWPPEAPITVGPEPADPPPYDEKALAEQVAKQVGWKQGDEAPGRVSNRQMLNKHFIWASVTGWSELVKVGVHSQAEWPAGSSIRCQYAHADSDGFLVFDTKQRGPKWKRRAL